MGVIGGLLVALLAVLLVLEPVLRGPRAAPPPPLSDGDDEVDPVQRRSDLALAALKEIEFDRATGKLSDEDYRLLYARYAADAAEALRAADAARADPVEHLISQARAAARSNGRGRFCTECGARLSGRGRFCTECGSRVTA